MTNTKRSNGFATAVYQKFNYENEYIRPPKGEYSERTVAYSQYIRPIKLLCGVLPMMIGTKINKAEKIMEKR